jgi:hypothetical protein
VREEGLGLIKEEEEFNLGISKGRRGKRKKEQKSEGFYKGGKLNDY